MNEQEFAYCRIDKWHNKGFKGEGVKIANIEGSKLDITLFDGKVFDPMGTQYSKTAGCTHSQNVIDILHQVAPEAEIYALTNSFSSLEPDKPNNLLSSLRWCIDNGINIVNMSVAFFPKEAKPLLEEGVAKGILFICAAGNDGSDGLSNIGRNEDFVAVGAVHMVNGKPKRASYSSIGPEIDAMGFSNLTAMNGNKLTGTSFASPFVAGMMAIYYEWHKWTKGRFPTVDEARKFLLENCIDLEKEGFDQNTGNGLFCLPELKEEPKPKIITMDVPSVIMHDRTYMPVRFIAEALGFTVDYVNGEVIIKGYGKEIQHKIGSQEITAKGV